MLQNMGKGFRAADGGTLGQDLGELIMNACQRRVSRYLLWISLARSLLILLKNLNIQIDALVNDSTATLLSRAYIDPSTRFALILGTGCNMAIHLPVSSLGSTKLGTRPQSWHDAASHVLVNTELSMFGRDILPTTRWDDFLNLTHHRPWFQPFEHLTSGRYLGEVVRLIAVEAVQSAGLFDGRVPRGFGEPYAFDTATMAAIEA